jgi:hypothetical protein
MYPYDELDPYMEQGRVLKKAAAKRINAGDALTSNVMGAPASVLPSAIDSYRSQANRLSDRAFKMMDTPMDYSGLQNFAKQRGEQGDSAMLNAMAAQFAGEGFAPLQEQLMKKASSASDPIKMSGGLITSDGSFVKDPEASQDKQVNMLLQRSAQLSQIAETAASTQERNAAQRAQQELANQMRMMGINIQQQGVDLRRDINENKAGLGNFSHEGYTPNNERVVTHSRTGQSFLLGTNPNGTPTYEPYEGAVIPKASYEKEVIKATEALASARRAQVIIEKVESNPEAFSLTSNALSMLPNALQGRATGLLLNEDTLKIRSDVLRQAAMEINDLYGAALSAGESARAATFIPDAKDPPNVVIDKLKSARDWGYANAKKHGSAIENSAQLRSGTASSNSTNELSADELAELAALKAKHRGGTP